MNDDEGNDPGADDEHDDGEEYADDDHDDGEEYDEDEYDDDGDAEEYADDEYDDEDEYDDGEYSDDGEYGDEEYDDEGLPPLVRTIGLALGGVLILAVIGWFVVRPALTSDDGNDDALVVDDQALTTDAATTTDGEPSSTTAAVVVVSEPPATDAPVETDAVEDTVGSAETETTDAPSTRVTTTEAPVETDPATTTEAPVETDPPPATEAPAGTDAPATTAAAAGSTDGGVTYDTLPDGSPAPVVAVFGEDRITLTGAVPSQQAKDRLQALALANAKPGQGETIVDFVTINPDVPIGVGVRVVELTSARFPELSAEILPAHAAELDRVVAVMNALPNVTALVIGHADQRGTALRNYAISDQRADAVVLYLASKGIAADRLASRAVGSSDLLTLNDDAVALALNRRTEFVFYGLLVE